MKSKITFLFLFLVFVLSGLNVFSQCTPATPEECPDPENNGEICPDSLAMAFVGQPYSQVATIVSPPTFIMEDSTVITLHHVKLMEVGNLPEGINWVSNAEDSVFMAGEYYCVLMDGTPEIAGEYPLHITVDVYVLIFGIPVKVATVTDSTSLTMLVVDDAGIKGHTDPDFLVRRNVPNPFHAVTRIEFYSRDTGPVTFEVYSLLGEKVYEDLYQAYSGDNILTFDGQALPTGFYSYVLRFENRQASGIMIRTD